MADYARGERLRELRDSKHASQEAVAFALGVSTKSVRSWEHGGKIRWPNAKKVAAYYGADAETLVSRELPEATDSDATPQSQLDRIEQRVEAIYSLLTGAEGEAGQAVQIVDETVRGVEAAASHRKQATGQPANPAATPPRKTA